METCPDPILITVCDRPGWQYTTMKIERFIEILDPSKPCDEARDTLDHIIETNHVLRLYENHHFKVPLLFSYFDNMQLLRE
jgi:hypothetical protein